MRIIYITLTLLLSFLTYQLGGQDRFERIYQTQGSDVLASSLHAYGSGYVALGVEIDDIGERPYIHLIKMDNKGTIEWNMAYDYSDDDVYISSLGEVVVHDNGQITFSAFLQKDSLNRVITHVDNNGSVLWSVTTGEMDGKFSANTNRSSLLAVPTDVALHGSSIVAERREMPLLTALSSTGEMMWGQQYSATDDNGAILSMGLKDMTMMSDSTILLAGSGRDEGHQIWLMKMDTLGRVLWSRSYTAELSGGLSQSAIGVTEMLDGSITILGAQASVNANGLLIHVSSTGEYIQSRLLRTTDPIFDIVPVGIVPMPDTSVGIALRRINLTTNEVRPVILRFGMDSTVYYQTMLKSATDISPTQGGYTTLDSLSSVFLTSTTRVDSMTLYPYLTKVDPTGMTGCEEEVDIISYDSIHVTIDTLIWSRMEQTQSGTIEVTDVPYRYSPPILSVQDTTYCPDDPIMYTIDATTRGAISYLWEDGSTDSVRVVTEAGQYIVNVTVGIEECFTLCDTANVTQLEEPMADIVPDPQNFCADGSILLGVQSNNPPTDITWSTGAKTPAIRVTDLTEYSVTIVDGCGLSATASENLGDFSIENNPSITVSGANLCTDGSLLLIAQGEGINPANLIWYKGDVGDTQIAQGVDRVSVAEGEVGEYSVENLETFCPGQASVTLIADQFLTPLSVEISGACQAPNYVLTASSTGAATIQWEDGSTAATRVVSAAGSYAVVVTDICGNTDAASIEVSENDIRNCGNQNPEPTDCTNNCLQWPNAFYPGANQAVNRTYGPEERECSGSSITDYSLSIYNRWGQLIYESSSLTDRWNGQKDNTGKEQPGATYFYYAKYTIDGESCSREGDILLIR